MNLTCNEPLSNVAFNVSERRYIEGCLKCGTTVAGQFPSEDSGLCCHKTSKVGCCMMTIPELNASLVLKLKCGEPLSNFTFNCILRRYTNVAVKGKQTISTRWCASGVEPSVCSEDYMVAGCKCGQSWTGGGFFHLTFWTDDNPAPDQGCCNRGTHTFVPAGERCTSTAWCKLDTVMKEPCEYFKDDDNDAASGTGASRRRGLLSQLQFAYVTERSSGPWGSRGAPGAELNDGDDMCGDGDAGDEAECRRRQMRATAMLGGEVDTFGIKRECEAKPRCIGFKISSTGCVTFLLSAEELDVCREVGRCRLNPG